MAKQPRIGCAICKGSEEPGWVCEDHEDKPWKHDGCGGAGVHCACNPDSLVAWKVDRLGRDALAAITVARQSKHERSTD